MKRIEMRKILLLCCLVLMVFQASAFAVPKSSSGKTTIIPQEEAYIGGVGPGCTFGYVKSIYGEPRETKWDQTGRPNSKMGVIYYIQWIYSDSFIVHGRKGSHQSLEEDDIPVVGVTLKDNSLATSRGWTIGMPYADVLATFGEGRKRDSKDGNTFHYSYYTDESQLCALTFSVNRDGIISGISVYQNQ